jgi:hypothetical protein
MAIRWWKASSPVSRGSPGSIDGKRHRR